VYPGGGSGGVERLQRGGWGGILCGSEPLFGE